jgi:hypothetical protein
MSDTEQHTITPGMNFQKGLAQTYSIPTAAPNPKLEVQPIKNSTKIKITPLDKVDDYLPQPPFTMAFVASKGSGKSTIIANLISRPEFYYKKFDQVWMFSPTFFLDTTYQKVKLNEERIVTDTTKFQDVFSGIIDSVTRQIDAIKQAVSIQAMSMGWSKERQKEEVEIQKHDQLDKILIIIDDAVGVKALDRNSMIANSFTRHRHLNISFLYAIQMYKSLPPVVRVNLTALILFRVWNTNELKKISEEQTVEVKEDTWMQIYDYATKEPFSFLYINFKHPRYRYFKNFTTPLIVQRE